MWFNEIDDTGAFPHAGWLYARIFRLNRIDRDWQFRLG